MKAILRVLAGLGGVIVLAALATAWTVPPGPQHWLAEMGGGLAAAVCLLCIAPG